MGLFDSLAIGTSGLNVAQTAIAVTGHNIANVNNEDYTRQRVDIRANTPFHIQPGDIGRGAKVFTVARIHDEFTYTRLRDTGSKVEYNNFTKQELDTVTKIFADLEGVGIQNGFKEYFDAWSDISTNPGNQALKSSLANKTSSLVSLISNSRESLQNTQDLLNDKVEINVKEFNRLAKNIADVNADIQRVESTAPNRANDLRDERDKLELALAKVIDIDVHKGHLSKISHLDTAITDQGKDYYLNVQGHSIVDGVTFHPLVVSNDNTPNSYHSIYYESQDKSRVDLGDQLSGGRLGAILDLRGRSLDEDGNFRQNSGKIDKYIKQLDTLASAFIRNTNSIYAANATEATSSNRLEDLFNQASLVDADDNIQTGNFDVIVYNSSGEEVAKKSISIDSATMMYDSSDTDNSSNSIISKLNKNTDDNLDNSTLNDVDDYFGFNFSDNTMNITQKIGKEGFHIAIVDNDTMFAGTIGLNRFLSGSSAKDIKLDKSFVNNPSSISAHKANIFGNNEVANEMIQLQYESVSFNDNSLTTTLDEYYTFFTSNMATDAQDASNKVDTSTAIFSAVEQEYQSISGVNLDEELANLMKFQASYQASAKVITTIDKMLDALLSIK